MHAGIVTQPRRRRAPGGALVALGLALAPLAACGDPATTPVGPETATPPSLGLAGNPTGWDLPLMDAGQLARAIPGRPCAASAHRAFDFWVGDWKVVEPNTGRSFGTNRVTTELDGCLVQETYTANNGIRGLSLNAYDAETGSWHQAWVSQIPQAFIGRLRTSGGLVDGTMVLRDRRDADFQGTPFMIEDEWTWTPTADGHVIQTGHAFAGPPFNQVLTDFTARYERADLAPTPPVETPFCQDGFPGAPTRAGDFLVGEWQVAGPSGLQVGASTIEVELSGCLFVERFESRMGLRAVAYTYWDRWNGDWYRIWIDDQGERLELRGGFEGTRLVLTGIEASRGTEVRVRLTFEPAGGGLRQSWEVSRDGGVTWSRGAELEYAAS